MILFGERMMDEPRRVLVPDGGNTLLLVFEEGTFALECRSTFERDSVFELLRRRLFGETSEFLALRHQHLRPVSAPVPDQRPPLRLV